MKIFTTIYFFLYCGNIAAETFLHSQTKTEDIPASGRIFNGIKVHPKHSLPYQAKLFHKRYFTCGGTIISKNFVLTAAHCVFGRNASDSYVKLGYGSRNAAKYSVSEIIIYDAYQQNKNIHDIALLKLGRNINFNKYMRPACLPADVNDLYVGKKALVSGWGQTESLPYSPYLMMKTVNILSSNDKICGTKTHDNYKQICASAYRYRRDVGSGDSGGPLVIREDGKNTVIGIVSHARLTKCKYKWNNGKLERECYFVIDVYIRVTGFLNWIKEKVGNGWCT